MLSTQLLIEVIHQQSTKEEKVERIVNFLDHSAIGLNHGKVIYQGYSYYDEYHYSSSIIENRDKGANSNYLNDFVIDHLDKQKAIHLIIDALNNICLTEDKEVFVERFILHKKMASIKQQHCLSNNGYYQCLDRAMNDCYNYLLQQCNL